MERRVPWSVEFRGASSSAEHRVCRHPSSLRVAVALHQNDCAGARPDGVAGESEEMVVVEEMVTATPLMSGACSRGDVRTDLLFLRPLRRGEHPGVGVARIPEPDPAPGEHRSLKSTAAHVASGRRQRSGPPARHTPGVRSTHTGRGVEAALEAAVDTAPSALPVLRCRGGVAGPRQNTGCEDERERVIGRNRSTAPL